MSVEEVEAAEISSSALAGRAGDEPVALRASLRDAIGDDPVVGLGEAIRSVSELLYSNWETDLAPRGVDARSFSEIVSGVSNEVWLWLMGDRPYTQLTAAIAGRSLRRSRPPSART